MSKEKARYRDFFCVQLSCSILKRFATRLPRLFDLLLFLRTTSQNRAKAGTRRGRPYSISNTSCRRRQPVGADETQHTANVMKIGCTQPRCVAACFDEEVRTKVGYTIHPISDKTVIKYMNGWYVSS